MMTIRKDRLGVRVRTASGEVEVRPALDHQHDGLAGELGDGESFTFPDGCVVTRRGDVEVWFTPPKVVLATA